MFSNVSEKFCLIEWRVLAKQIWHECVLCARIQSSTFNLQIANNQYSRINPQPPFYICGTDYIGPFMIHIKPIFAYSFALWRMLFTVLQVIETSDINFQLEIVSGVLPKKHELTCHSS